MPDPGANRPRPGPLFADVRRLVETDSTNRVALELARAGAPEGVVVVADHQTAGRGRLGRSWVAPPGSSLLLSVLLRPALAPGQLQLVTLAVALAAADACERVAGVVPSLKWPNDLMAGDRKLAGILAEAVWEGDRLDGLVVGLGLNVEWPADMPAEVADAAVALNQLAGRSVDREEVLAALLDALELWYERLPGGVLDEYRHRCATLDQDVRVDLGGGREPLVGRAVDLSGDGHLLVAVAEGGVHEVAAGDVVHLRPA